MNSVEQLVAFRKTVGDDDSHLVYTTRLTLRNLLRNSNIMRDAAIHKWQAGDAKVLSTVLVGVESSLAASFLFNYLHTNNVPEHDLPRTLKHIVRYVPAAKVNEAIMMGMQKASGNAILEATIFQNMKDGVASRGMQQPPQLENWARQVVKKIMDKKLRPSDKSSNDEAGALLFAVESAGNYKVAETKNELAELFNDTSVRSNLRSAALQSIMKMDEVAGAKLAEQQLKDSSSNPAFRRNIVFILSEFPGSAVNNALASVSNAPPDLLQGIRWWRLPEWKPGRKLLFEKVRKGEVFARTLTDRSEGEGTLVASK